MSSPCNRSPRMRRGNVAIGDENDERILAHRAADIRGKSRTQVLGSGGRVRQRGNQRSPELGRNRRQRTLDAHRARSDTEADSGGLKLSNGRASNSGCRVYPPNFPSQGEMTYG